MVSFKFFFFFFDRMDKLIDMINYKKQPHTFGRSTKHETLNNRLYYLYLAKALLLSVRVAHIRSNFNNWLKSITAVL